MSEKTLHILCQPPCETVGRLIDLYCSEDWITVVCLYGDDVSRQPVDWHQVVDSIFSHEKIICWW